MQLRSWVKSPLKSMPILQIDEIYSRKHYALPFVKVVPREPLFLDLKKSTQQVLSKYLWKASRPMNSTSKIHLERANYFDYDPGLCFLFIISFQILAVFSYIPSSFHSCLFFLHCFPTHSKLFTWNNHSNFGKL